MRWQGHVSVPGVSPEREIHLTAYPPDSVAQRREYAAYRNGAVFWSRIGVHFDPAVPRTIQTGEHQACVTL
jgi:hypothetical protein